MFLHSVSATKLTKSKEYKHKHSSLQNTGWGLTLWRCLSFPSEVPRAVLTVANLDEWHHHHLLAHAGDPGIIFHFPFSSTHSLSVMKSILLFPGSSQYSPFSVSPSHCLGWDTHLPLLDHRSLFFTWSLYLYQPPVSFTPLPDDLSFWFCDFW